MVKIFKLSLLFNHTYTESKYRITDKADMIKNKACMHLVTYTRVYIHVYFLQTRTNKV